MDEHKALLEKFLEGRCTAEEHHQVNQLLDTEAGHQMLIDMMEQNEEAKLRHSLVNDAEMQEWITTHKSDLLQRISEQKQSRRPFISRSIFRYAGIAAAFIGVVILSSVFFMNNNNSTGLFGGKEQAIAYVKLSNPDGIPELHKLPDGTQIWLAAGSYLKYPEAFDKKHRDVELTGEAFFDVARDEKRPFTIHSGGMETRVLGTSFKVTAFAGQEQEVSVATGKVSVSSNGQELALLTRGLQVRHNPTTGKTTRAEIDPTRLEKWKTGTLVFDELPMSLVAKQLENRYGIAIEFADPKIATHKISSTFFPQESVETVIKTLGIIGNFQYKSTENKRYTIY